MWVSTYKKHGRIVEVIHTGLSQEDACDIEKDLIELIGRRNLGLGTLVNLTDGGEGAVGMVWTDEMREDAKWSDERKAEVSANYTQEMRDAMSEMNSRPVIDTATGIAYSSMGVACDELGFKMSTITDQLRGKVRIQPYNTLRYEDDVDALGCELYEEPIVPFNEIKHSQVIDITTNKIYKTMSVACGDIGISYQGVRNQISGVRKRKDWNTLYKLSELVISPDGYETQEQIEMRAKEQTLETERLEKEDAKFKIIDKATGIKYSSMSVALRTLGIDKKLYQSINNQSNGRAERKDYNTLYYREPKPEYVRKPHTRREDINYYMEKHLERAMHKEVDEEIADLLAYMRRAS
jgi:hypothetical protein